MKAIKVSLILSLAVYVGACVWGYSVANQSVTVGEEVTPRVTVLLRVEDEEGLSHVIYLDGEGMRWASDCIAPWEVVGRFGNIRGIYID